MKKFLAAFLKLGLLVSTGAATASAAQLRAANGNSTYVGGNG